MREMTVLEIRFAEERGKTLHDFVVADRARRAEECQSQERRSEKNAQNGGKPVALGSEQRDRLTLVPEAVNE
jgi:hypothetical protein